MRQVMVEYARRRSAGKRGGGAVRVTFHDLAVQAPDPHVDVLALDLALNALKSVGARFTRVMELRYFAGCTIEEIAQITGASPRAVKRDVSYAKAWLREHMSSAAL
jgi:RNA polymerase sigma factor (TIGR02999 family)